MHLALPQTVVGLSSRDSENEAPVGGTREHPSATLSVFDGSPWWQERCPIFTAARWGDVGNYRTASSA
jgi:hypothetical protein